MDSFDSNELWVLALIVIGMIIMGFLVVYGAIGIVSIVIQALNHKPIHVGGLEFAGIVFIIVMLVLRPQINFESRK